MKPALLDKKPRYPRSWSMLPSGAERKAIVESELDIITQQFFGYHLVKVGNLSSELSAQLNTVSTWLQKSMNRRACGRCLGIWR